MGPEGDRSLFVATGSPRMRGFDGGHTDTRRSQRSNEAALVQPQTFHDGEAGPVHKGEVLVREVPADGPGRLQVRGPHSLQGSDAAPKSSPKGFRSLPVDPPPGSVQVSTRT